MKLSAKTDYACLAIMELAARYDSGEPVRVKEIAASHEIPPQFLVQILLQLKNAGLVASTRGASGGYRLCSSPEKVTLWDVVAVIEGRGEADGRPPASPFAKVLADVWSELTEQERDLLACTTFADLLARAKAGAGEMYYI